MNDLEKTVLQRIGENPSSPDVFDDITEIRDSINDAIEEICMLTGAHTEFFYMPLLKDRNFYRVSFAQGNYGWANNVWLSEQKRKLEQTDLIGLNAIDRRWQMAHGTPVMYTQISWDVICVYPKPSSDSGMIEITCAVIPGRYERDDDRVFLQSGWQRAATNYAIAEYWASRGDAVEARRNMNVYLDLLGERGLQPMAQEQVQGFKVQGRGL